jgi:kynurenine formamidase
MFDPRLKDLIMEGRIYDLGQPWYPGMPHHPLHPPFAFIMARKHGDYLYEGGASSANELFTFGAHTGTHIDAVGHISSDGILFGGLRAEDVQSYRDGLKALSIEETEPVFARGVMLDVAGHKGVEVLEPAFPIDRSVIEEVMGRQGVEAGQGDVVLVRTGWARYWDDPQRFQDHRGCPGVTLDGARLLCEKGVAMVGSDTMAFEVTPTATLEVHVFLLVEKGIQIMEMLNLEELARDRVWEFLFVVIPLRIRGGTASPVRPVAVR